MSDWEVAGEAGTSYVEGVGDEVLLTATFIIIALSVVILVFRSVVSIICAVNCHLQRSILIMVGS